MTKRRKVLVACCNGGGTYHKLVGFAAIDMVQDPRHEVHFIAPTWTPLEHSQHRVIGDALEQGFDFVLFMDDDNPPKNNPIDLVDLDLDVVNLPTICWHSAVKGDQPYYLNSWRLKSKEEGYTPICNDPDFQNKGLQPAEAVGGGCVLIARRVFVSLMARAQGNAMEMPFMRRWCDKTGRVLVGNDVAFSERARAAGFELWSHFDYPCEHINAMPLTEVVSAMAAFMVKK